AQFLGHVADERCHLLLLLLALLLRRRHGLRHAGWRFDDFFLAALAQPRRHHRPLDLGVTADRAADQGLPFLTFVGLAVLEPAFELMALRTAQAIQNHEITRNLTVGTPKGRVPEMMGCDCA